MLQIWAALGMLLVTMAATMAASGAALHQQGVDFYRQKKYPEAIAALAKAIAEEASDSA